MNEAMMAAPQVRVERLLGWATHYLVGVALAGLLIGLFGGDWSSALRPAPPSSSVSRPWFCQ